MSISIPGALRSFIRRIPSITESQVIVDLPRKSVAVSVHPEQASWWRDDGLVRRFKIPTEAIPISVSTEQVSW